MSTKYNSWPLPWPLVCKKQSTNLAETGCLTGDIVQARKLSVHASQKENYKVARHTKLPGLQSGLHEMLTTNLLQTGRIVVEPTLGQEHT